MNASSGFLPSVNRISSIVGICINSSTKAKTSLLVVLLMIHLSLASATGDIIVTAASRGVMAGATGAMLDTDSTVLPGLYLKDATATGVSPAGTVESFAHQDSIIPGFTGPSLSGVGSVMATADATVSTGFSNIGISVFDVSFDVTSTGFYTLDANVEWVGTSPPYGGFAKVELLNVSAGTTIASILRDPANPLTDSISGSYLLTTGTNYRLFARAEVSGGFGGTAGFYGASGNWGVVLSIPEPNSFFLCIMSLAFLASIRLRRTNNARESGKLLTK